MLSSVPRVHRLIPKQNSWPVGGSSCGPVKISFFKVFLLHSPTSPYPKRTSEEPLQTVVPPLGVTLLPPARYWWRCGVRRSSIEHALAVGKVSRPNDTASELSVRYALSGIIDLVILSQTHLKAIGGFASCRRPSSYRSDAAKGGYEDGRVPSALAHPRGYPSRRGQYGYWKTVGDHLLEHLCSRKLLSS